MVFPDHTHFHSYAQNIELKTSVGVSSKKDSSMCKLSSTTSQYSVASVPGDSGEPEGIIWVPSISSSEVITIQKGISKDNFGYKPDNSFVHDNLKTVS